MEQLGKLKKEACTAQILFDSKDELVRKDLMDSALWNFLVLDQQIATVQYKEPYKIIEKMVKSNDI